MVKVEDQGEDIPHPSGPISHVDLGASRADSQVAEVGDWLVAALLLSAATSAVAHHYVGFGSCGYLIVLH